MASPFTNSLPKKSSSNPIDQNFNYVLKIMKINNFQACYSKNVCMYSLFRFFFFIKYLPAFALPLFVGKVTVTSVVLTTFEFSLIPKKFSKSVDVLLIVGECLLVVSLVL